MKRSGFGCSSPFGSSVLDVGPGERGGVDSATWQPGAGAASNETGRFATAKARSSWSSRSTSPKCRSPWERRVRAAIGRASAFTKCNEVSFESHHCSTHRSRSSFGQLCPLAMWLKIDALETTDVAAHLYRVTAIWSIDVESDGRYRVMYLPCEDGREPFSCGTTSACMAESLILDWVMWRGEARRPRASSATRCDAPRPGASDGVGRRAPRCFHSGSTALACASAAASGADRSGRSSTSPG